MLPGATLLAASVAQASTDCARAQPVNVDGAPSSIAVGLVERWLRLQTVSDGGALTKSPFKPATTWPVQPQRRRLASWCAW